MRFRMLFGRLLPLTVSRGSALADIRTNSLNCYNALDSGSTTKLTICNKQVNRQAFEDTVLLPQRGDSLDGFVDEFNGMLTDKISGSSASVEQERFITVSVHKKNVDEARTFFSRVTGEVSSKLSRLNSSSNELDATERLDVLRGFFRPEEAALPFDLQTAMKRGHNLKDTICPDSLEFHRDYFKMGNQYGRVLFLKDYASYIKDSMILELTDLNRRMHSSNTQNEKTKGFAEADALSQSPRGRIHRSRTQILCSARNGAILHCCRFLAPVHNLSEAVIPNGKAAKPIIAVLFTCKFCFRRIDNVHRALYDFDYT